MKKLCVIFLLAALLLAAGCGGSASAPAPAQKATAVPEATAAPKATATAAPTPLPDMEVTSAGIAGGELGSAYGAKGEQFVNGSVPSRSLPLTVNYIPEGTAALALTMIDPDGGDWVHWLVSGLPVEGTGCEIPENASIDWAAQLTQGKNDFGSTGYGGPTPPSGVHRYVITVYALSEAPELAAGFSLEALAAAMEGKVLSVAAVTGTYAK